jgi:uncharacterized protein involved in tolerance to divalent cations
MHGEVVELVLTCGSWQESQRIADALLEKRLVDRVETFEIQPLHWHDSHSHHAQEVKVIVHSHAGQVDKIKDLTSKICQTKTAPVLLTELTK